MKAIFISFNQAYNEEIVEVLESFGQRGFTRWENVAGRGSVSGIPHYGNHAWPEMNISVLAMVDDAVVQPVLDALKEKDRASEALGLRAFVWNIEQSI